MPANFRKLRLDSDLDRHVMNEAARHDSSPSYVVSRYIHRYMACLNEGNASVKKRFDDHEIETLRDAFDGPDRQELLGLTSKEDIPNFLKYLLTRARQNNVRITPELQALIGKIDTVEFLSLVDLIVNGINEVEPYFGSRDIKFIVDSLSGVVAAKDFHSFHQGGPSSLAKSIQIAAENKNMRYMPMVLMRVRALKKGDEVYENMLADVRRALFSARSSARSV